ncbi:50S ribosomal protein L6 [Candidatus Gottesmanbacteria bacterium]|nr:50S ribosomal protein L6 [Candidatus Gottesmanbacteria bacterium]
MSRIGNAPIIVPQEVRLEISDTLVRIEGPKGKLEQSIPSHVGVVKKDGTLVVSSNGNGKQSNALHGFFRATLANAITGVVKDWSKTLELSGVGYRAAVSNNNLTLTVGFSHPVIITPPQGVTLRASEGKIIVSGVDRQLVGQVAASIRKVKPPEPYKGKGIKYEGEYIRKKAGKSAKAVGGAPGGTK